MACINFFSTTHSSNPLHRLAFKYLHIHAAVIINRLKIYSVSFSDVSLALIGKISYSWGRGGGLVTFTPTI